MAFNRYKYNAAEKRGGGETALVLDELAEIVSDKENAEQAYEHKELVEAINAFLGSLSAEKRKIFIRRYWYADSVSDIATRFGMSYPAVSMVLNRLRVKLRDYLIERGYEL